MDILEQGILMFEPHRHSAGYLLYRLHAATVVGLIVLFIVYPKVRRILFVLFIPFFAVHVLYGSCPVTRVERRLHGENITVIDPLILLFALPITRATRDTTQVILSTLVFVGMLLLL